MKIAFVIQRYGTEIIGGAEYFTRLVAEHLQNFHSIEILTTCAKEYHTWQNNYSSGYEKINGVTVRRFRNLKFRDMSSQIKIQEKVFYQQHSRGDEVSWIEEQGPFSPELVEFIKEHKNDYDLFVFFTYRYYPCYFGIKGVENKSVIVPFAENDPAINLLVTSELFNNAGALIYSTPEERDLIKSNVRFDEDDKKWAVIGCGIEIPLRYPEPPPSEPGDYILYLGRIEGSKGCYQLFEFYLRYISGRQNAPDLILAGFDAIEIPKNKKIRYLGFVSEEDKIRLLRNAKILIMPSPYESFSIVTLESMACGTPVLVNGECEVLKGHCIRSNAGLWYMDFDEFKECLSLLSSDQRLREEMKTNGMRYVKDNYSWDSVCNRYLKFFDEVKTRED